MFCLLICSFSITYFIFFGFSALIIQVKRARKKLIFIYQFYILRKIYCKRLEELKNSYSGKSCFIIGNGPSLTPADLELIKDKYSFASNRIYSIFNHTSWRPSFYCIQDSILIREVNEKISELKLGQIFNFFSLNSWKYYTKKIKNNKSNYFYFLDTNVKNIDSFLGLKNNVSKRVYEGRSITVSALQIAIFMGFTKIYLLGVDHTSSIKIENDLITRDNSIIDYFSGIDNDGITKRPYYKDFTEKAYMRLKQYAERNNIEIINLTRGGKLEIFKRSDLETILNITK